MLEKNPERFDHLIFSLSAKIVLIKKIIFSIVPTAWGLLIVFNIFGLKMKNFIKSGKKFSASKSA